MLARIPDSLDAIGGYFALEPGRAGAVEHLTGAAAFQSARAAFLALLESCRPACVHVPWYLCDSMREPLRQAGVASRAYAIDAEFRPAEPLALEPDEWLLVVNYFGLCDGVVADLQARHPPGQIVVDNAQAFFAAPTPCRASLYSPRKFFGVPDGGFLHAPGVEPRDCPRDTGSAKRMAHLTRRLELGAEAGYADYVAAEESLSGQPPLRMSRLSEQLLTGADHAEVARRRRRNFALLDEHLAAHNELSWNLGAAQVPLCYPFLPARAGLRAGLRAELLSARIYVAQYWRELTAPDRAVPAHERRLAAGLLPLPVDQRYSAETLMRHLVEPLLATLEG
jgi:hypothetical protein